MHTAVDEVHARDAGPAGGGGVAGLGQLLRLEAGRFMLKNLVQLAVGNLADDLTVSDQAVAGGHVNQLGCLEPDGDFAGEVVRVYAVGVALAVETKRRDDRDVALCEQSLEVAKVDPFRLAGVPIVDTVDDAARVGGHRVGRDASQPVGGEALKYLVRQPVGRRECEF